MKKGDYSTIKKAKRYDKERFSGNLKTINMDEIDIIRTFIARNLHSHSPIILDIGAGTGRVTKELIRFKPKNLFALDQSKTMLNLLIENLHHEYESGVLKIIVSNSDNIPLNNNSLDLAVSMHLFKHLTDLKPTINETSRILKKGGLFLFDFLNSRSLIKLRPTTCSIYNLQYIQGLLRDSGFLAVDHKYVHGFGETIYRFIYPNCLNFFHKIDAKISNKLHIGTKVIIIARKI